MWNGRVIWEKIPSIEPAPNDNIPSGANSPGNAFDASPESQPAAESQPKSESESQSESQPESQPKSESESQPNLPSPTPAQTFLSTLWNGGIKNYGSKYMSCSFSLWSQFFLS